MGLGSFGGATNRLLEVELESKKSDRLSAIQWKLFSHAEWALKSLATSIKQHRCSWPGWQKASQSAWLCQPLRVKKAIMTCKAST